MRVPSCPNCYESLPVVDGPRLQNVVCLQCGRHWGVSFLRPGVWTTGPPENPAHDVTEFIRARILEEVTQRGEAYRGSEELSKAFAGWDHSQIDAWCEENRLAIIARHDGRIVICRATGERLRLHGVTVDDSLSDEERRLVVVPPHPLVIALARDNLDFDAAMISLASCVTHGLQAVTEAFRKFAVSRPWPWRDAVAYCRAYFVERGRFPFEIEEWPEEISVPWLPE